MMIGVASMVSSQFSVLSSRFSDLSLCVVRYCFSMAGTGSFQDLIVWQKAMALAKSIYELTRDLPADERFGLVRQMRDAAISIPSNIAEGHGRRTTGEFAQFLGISTGS